MSYNDETFPDGLKIYPIQTNPEKISNYHPFWVLGTWYGNRKSYQLLNTRVPTEVQINRRLSMKKKLYSIRYCRQMQSLLLIIITTIIIIRNIINTSMCHLQYNKYKIFYKKIKLTSRNSKKYEKIILKNKSNKERILYNN